MAQVFINEGLDVLFNQVITSHPNTYSSLYCGIFTGTIPAATTTLSAVGSGWFEQTGSGYNRQPVTWSGTSLATSYAVPFAQTTLSGSVTSSYLITVGSFSIGSYALLAVGMTLYINSTAYVITSLPNSNQIVLSSAITASNGATITIGDAVSGQKVRGTAVIFGPATGNWSTASSGYFVTTAASGSSGYLLYAANFADGSTPVLSVNDTLTVTPTWLMSN